MSLCPSESSGCLTQCPHNMPTTLTGPHFEFTTVQCRGLHHSL